MINLEKSIIGEVQFISDVNERYVHSLELRARNHNYLVDVFAIFKGDTLNNDTNQTVYCSNLNQKYPIQVVIENIHYRLPDLGSINYR
jgi:hypothetical protein